MSFLLLGVGLCTAVAILGMWWAFLPEAPNARPYDKLKDDVE